jgi:hypothetical protein
MRPNRHFAQQLERLLLQIDWNDNLPIAPAKDDVIAKLRKAQKEIRSIIEMQPPNTDPNSYKNEQPPKHCTNHLPRG